MRTSLDELVRPDSSIVIAINPSKKLSWKKNPKTVAVIITVNLAGHGDGKLFTDPLLNLEQSIVDGVETYIANSRKLILAQFTDSEKANITEIR